MHQTFVTDSHIFFHMIKLQNWNNDYKGEKKARHTKDVLKCGAPLNAVLTVKSRK